MESQSSELRQLNIVIFRNYIFDIAMKRMKNRSEDSNDQRLEAWSLTYKKSNFSFYCTAVIQQDMVLSLELDEEKLYPLLKLIFRRYTLRRLQFEQRGKNSGQKIDDDSGIVTQNLLEDSLDECCGELHKIEKLFLVRSKWKFERFLIKMFGNYLAIVGDPVVNLLLNIIQLDPCCFCNNRKIFEQE